MADDVLARIVDTLHAERERQQLTQRQVAERAGLYHPIICTYERQRYVPSTTKLIAWAGALGYDLTLMRREAVKPVIHLEIHSAPSPAPARQIIVVDPHGRRLA